MSKYNFITLNKKYYIILFLIIIFFICIYYFYFIIKKEKFIIETYENNILNIVNNIFNIDNVFYKITKIYVDNDNIGEVMIDNGIKLNIEDYIIPEYINYNNYKYKIVEINEYAFYKNKNLKGSLTIPGTIHTIGHFAFAKCFNLNGNLTLNTGILYINSYAFCGLINLQGTVEIPNTVELIEEHAFELCININTLNFKLDNSQKSSLKYIGFQAFCMCIKLTGELIIPGSVETIELYAFYQTNLDNIILEEGIINISSDLLELNRNLNKNKNNINYQYKLPTSIPKNKIKNIDNNNTTKTEPSKTEHYSTNKETYSITNKETYRKKPIKLNLKELPINRDHTCPARGNHTYFGKSCEKEINCGAEVENSGATAAFFSNTFYNDILFNINSNVNIFKHLACGRLKTDARCSGKCLNYALCLSSFDGGKCDCTPVGRSCYYSPNCSTEVRCSRGVVKCGKGEVDTNGNLIPETVCEYRD